MANKKKTYNTGRKIMVLRDQLGITNGSSGGCYALMPFSTLDRKGNAVFKVGMSTSSMEKRMDQYTTYFPLGVYYIAFLIDARVPNIRTRTMTQLKNKTQVYLEIEKFIIDYILKLPGTKRITSTGRIRELNEENRGASEWIYCNEVQIHQAFAEAQKKYGGKKYLFYLEGHDPITGQLTSINDEAREQERNKPLYTGKIIFKN